MESFFSTLSYIGVGIHPRKPEWPTRLLSAITERVSTTTLGRARFCRANTLFMRVRRNHVDAIETVTRSIQTAFM